MVADILSEESPSSIGQDAGQLPVRVTSRIVQQRDTAPTRGKGGKVR
jgi:hypothetical protein